MNTNEISFFTRQKKTRQQMTKYNIFLFIFYEFYAIYINTSVIYALHLENLCLK